MKFGRLETNYLPDSAKICPRFYMHSTLRFPISLLCGALLISALSACKTPETASNGAASNGAASNSTDSNAATSSAGNTATVAVSPAKPYTGDTLIWGEFGSLTGDTATFGTSTNNALKMAIAEINVKGAPLGKKIELRTEDDGSQVSQVTSVVKKLIDQEGALVILGEVASSRSLAAAPICEGAGVPMLSPSSTNPKVTQGRNWIFRSCFIDSFQGEAMVKFSRQNLKAKTAAILTNNGQDYSKGLSDVFAAGFKAAGGTVVDTQSYQDSDTDFRAQLNSIKAKNPDVIYVPDYYNKCGAIAQQARNSGITVPLLGGDGWDSPKLFDVGKEAVNNSYFTNHYAPMDKNPRVVKFVTDYKKLYGETPDSLAACAYDAAYVMADAIKRAGSTDRGKIRDALASTKGFAGITGTITINKDHDVTKPLAVLKVDGGKQNFVTNITP